MNSNDAPREPAIIRFYRANEKPHGRFSNLHPFPVTVRGIEYGCVEAAYQSLKPRKAEVRQWLLAAPYPRLLANAAHSFMRHDIAPRWSTFRFAWMMECLRAKYRQDQEAGDLLLETKGAQLVEAGTVDNPVNRSWGIVNGEGTNYLGRLLMLVRAEMGGPPCADPEMTGLVESGRDSLEAWYVRVHAS